MDRATKVLLGQSETRKAASVSSTRAALREPRSSGRGQLSESYASARPSRMCSGSTRYSGAYSPSIPPSIRSMTSSGILIFR